MSQTLYPDDLLRTIRGCARCGGEHVDLAFRKLIQPMCVTIGGVTATWQRWAECPTAKAPIMLAILPEEGAAP